MPAVEFDLGNGNRNQAQPADWALQWLWNQPEVSVVLSGMSSMTQVEENIASANLSGLEKLTGCRAGLITLARETYHQLSPIPCTDCEYCLPCPNGVEIPRNFAVYNEAIMFNDPEHAREAYKRWIPDEAKASVSASMPGMRAKVPAAHPHQPMDAAGR